MVSGGRKDWHGMLRWTDWPKPLPSSFSFAQRQMRNLCSVVQCLTWAMVDIRHNLTLGRSTVDRSLAVTIRFGAHPCFFDSRTSKCLTALVLRRVWTISSSTNPSWSAVHNNKHFLPPMGTTTSSRCQRSLAEGVLWHNYLVSRAPYIRHHRRIVSWETTTPRSSIISSTSRRLRFETKI